VLGEIPFEESSRYLWPSPDKSTVPGPDSLVARMRTDENFRAHIEIENLRTGESYRLIDANAFLPHWSADGKYIACAVWKSPGQRSELTIVEVATRTEVLDPPLKASVDQMKWSPNSAALAADGVIYGRPRTLLYTVPVPAGATTVIDTLKRAFRLRVFLESERTLDRLFATFGARSIGEDPIASDVWIADAKTGRKWPLVVSTDWVESNPLWITSETLSNRSHDLEGREARS